MINDFFAKVDGSINMQEYACDLYDTELFLNIDGIVSDATIIDKNDFFTNLSDTTIDDSVTITLVGTNGSTSVRYLNNINKAIPEPSTATLSLLALVTLSMRRRRRQGNQKAQLIINYCCILPPQKNTNLGVGKGRNEH